MQSVTLETKQGKVTMIQEKNFVNFYDKNNQVIEEHAFNSEKDAATCFNNNVRWYI